MRGRIFTDSSKGTCELKLFESQERISELEVENAKLKEENKSLKKISSRVIDNAVINEQGDVFEYRKECESLRKQMENLRCGVKELISSLKLDEHQGDVLDSLDYFYISHPEFKAV